MPEKPPKTRIITVRLSNEEYESLRAATASKGYRTVSELARAGMHKVADDQLPPHQILARRVDEHSARIAALALELERLNTPPRIVFPIEDSADPNS
jgi:Arc/MetJ-type ribon-helix-helix transcriptional regulator